MTRHPSNGKLQFFDAVFVKNDFEQITIISKNGGISTTDEFVIISHVVRDKINSGTFGCLLSSTDDGIEFASRDRLGFAW